MVLRSPHGWLIRAVIIPSANTFLKTTTTVPLRFVTRLGSRTVSSPNANRRATSTWDPFRLNYFFVVAQSRFCCCCQLYNLVNLYDEPVTELFLLPFNILKNVMRSTQTYFLTIFDIQVGRCKSGELKLDKCTGGGNAFADLDAGNGQCHAGKWVAVEITCTGRCRKLAT